MEISAMQDLRAAMESRLARVAAEVVDEFQRRCGVQVTSVHINLVDGTAVGDASRTSVVAGVEIDVSL